MDLLTGSPQRAGCDTGAVLAGRMGFSVTLDLLTIGRRYV